MNVPVSSRVIPAITRKCCNRLPIFFGMAIVVAEEDGAVGGLIMGRS